MSKKVKTGNERVRIVPLGGLEQIGMNITAFETEESIIVVDCGLAFPEDDMLGVDLVIPDITYLQDNRDKVKGFVITHGHEDHIGALPYVLKELNVPIYATNLTMAIIENKLKEHNLMGVTRRKVVSYGQYINLGDFRIEFIRTNHSIADSAALAIYTPAGVIVHTGDFKVDYTPVYGDSIDLARFGELGKKGVLALMADSTNVLKPGFTMSERTVGKTFDTIFDENEKSRIIVATFASNVDRVQQIINSARKHGRKVIVEGRSMVNIINTAVELGYIQAPDNIIISIEEMKNYSDEQIVLVTTGSQGEAMAALSRIAASIHRKVTIKPGDTVIFSSNPIPGNEKSVSKVINELSMKGAKVIFQDAHVSGHACQEELKLIYSLVRPKFAIPVHGEYRHLLRHGELAQEMGISKENVVIMKSGNVLELKEERIETLEKEIENKREGFRKEQFEAQKKLDDTIAKNQKLQSETTDLRLKNSELWLEYYENVDKLTDKQKAIEVAKKEADKWMMISDTAKLQTERAEFELEEAERLKKELLGEVDGDDYLKEKVIELRYQNQILREENRSLKDKLEKAYEFMKQFVIGGINLLEKFMEWIGEKVKDVGRGR